VCRCARGTALCPPGLRSGTKGGERGKGRLPVAAVLRPSPCKFFPSLATKKREGGGKDRDVLDLNILVKAPNNEGRRPLQGKE